MSSINPNNINGQYPIAGQDNDSQGFRDNFTNIKNNFLYAYNEISDLQQNAILKKALSGGSVSNDMNYNQLIHAQLLGTTETVNPIGDVTGPLTVNWQNGSIQTFNATGAVTLSFISWPANSLYARLRLVITAASPNTVITFPAAVSVNISSITGASGQNITLDQANTPYVFDLTTSDAGNTIYISDVLRNYAGLGNVSVTQANITLANIANIDGPTALNGGLTITGNIASTGAHRETGYQQIKTGANVAVTVNSNVNRVLLHPSSGVISFGANITLPNVLIDGTIVNISSNVTIASLDVRPGWNGVVNVSPAGNVNSISAGTNTRYFYIAADATWYKIA